MSSDADDAKRALRSEMRTRIGSLKPFSRLHRSRRLAATVLRSPPLAGTGLVLAYRALPDEIDVDDVVRALAAHGWRIAFPHVDANGKLILLEIASSDPLLASFWTRDRFGISAPDAKAAGVRKVLAREIDAVITPGRAFAPNGARLGRGKGFYDSLFGRLRPDCRRSSLGVCYREQLVDCVPEGPSDRRVAFVAAEGRLIRCSRGR